MNKKLDFLFQINKKNKELDKFELIHLELPLEKPSQETAYVQEIEDDEKERGVLIIPL